MKKSELRQLIREEISSVLKESKFKKHIHSFESFLNEGSDITPERMLRSVYDNLKTSLNVGKIDTKSDYPYFNFSAGNLIKGTVESRDGKILISFDEINIKVNPKQRDIIYDGDVVLTKDYIRNEALKIIRDYMFTVGKLK
jgi:hypothetical protein